MIWWTVVNTNPRLLSQFLRCNVTLCTNDKPQACLYNVMSWKLPPGGQNWCSKQSHHWECRHKYWGIPFQKLKHQMRFIVMKHTQHCRETVISTQILRVKCSEFSMKSVSSILLLDIWAVIPLWWICQAMQWPPFSSWSCLEFLNHCIENCEVQPYICNARLDFTDWR